MNSPIIMQKVELTRQSNMSILRAFTSGSTNFLSILVKQITFFYFIYLTFQNTYGWVCDWDFIDNKYNFKSNCRI